MAEQKDTEKRYQTEQLEIKRLHQELRRKDKALAAAADRRKASEIFNGALAAGAWAWRAPLYRSRSKKWVLAVMRQLSQDLSLRSCGEQLHVEKFIPEPAVERPGKDDLPRGSRLDAGHGGGAANRTPVP
jgi:hypothetical protein